MTLLNCRPLQINISDIYTESSTPFKSLHIKTNLLKHDITMTTNQLIKLILISLVFGQLTSCEKHLGGKHSTYNSQSSHNVGMDCKQCHYNGGEGDYNWEVAGSVYNENGTLTKPNSTIKLYTGFHETGKLNHTIEVDAYGNFYTTKNIHFGSGLYPSIIGDSITKHMVSPITTGSCNSCHGVTTDLLWTR